MDRRGSNLTIMDKRSCKGSQVGHPPQYFGRTLLRHGVSDECILRRKGSAFLRSPHLLTPRRFLSLRALITVST